LNRIKHCAIYVDSVDFPDNVLAVTVLLVSEFIPALAYCRGPISATARIMVKFCDSCTQVQTNEQGTADVGATGQYGANVGTSNQGLVGISGKWGGNSQGVTYIEAVGHDPGRKPEEPRQKITNSAPSRPEAYIPEASGEPGISVGSNRQGKEKDILSSGEQGKVNSGAKIQGFDMGARHQGVTNVGSSGGGAGNLWENGQGVGNTGQGVTNVRASGPGSVNLGTGGQWEDNVRSSGKGISKIITKNGMDLEKKITVRRSEEESDLANLGLNVEEDPNYPILIGLVFVVTLIALSLIIGVIYFWCPEICACCIRKSHKRNDLNGTTKILTVKDNFGNIISEAKTVEVWKTGENKIKTYDILTRELSGLKKNNKVGYKELQEDPDGSNFNSREESHKEVRTLPQDDGEIIIIRQPNNVQNMSRLTYLEELDPRTLTPYQSVHPNHGRLFRLLNRPEPERRYSRQYLNVENPRSYRSVTPLDLVSVNGSENNLNFSRHYSNNSRAGQVIMEVDPRERNRHHSYRNLDSDRDYRREDRHWESRYDEMDSPRKSDVQILTVHANDNDSEHSYRSLNVIPEENFSPRYQNSSSQYPTIEERGRPLQRSERKENEKRDQGVNTDSYKERSKSLQDQRSPRRDSKGSLTERSRSLQDHKRERWESPRKETSKERRSFLDQFQERWDTSGPNKESFKERTKSIQRRDINGFNKERSRSFQDPKNSSRDPIKERSKSLQDQKTDNKDDQVEVQKHARRFSKLPTKNSIQKNIYYQDSYARNINAPYYYQEREHEREIESLLRQNELRRGDLRLGRKIKDERANYLRIPDRRDEAPSHEREEPKQYQSQLQEVMSTFSTIVEGEPSDYEDDDQNSPERESAPNTGKPNSGQEESASSTARTDAADVNQTETGENTFRSEEAEAEGPPSDPNSENQPLIEEDSADKQGEEEHEEEKQNQQENEENKQDEQEHEEEKHDENQQEEVKEGSEEKILKTEPPSETDLRELKESLERDEEPPEPLSKKLLRTIGNFQDTNRTPSPAQTLTMAALKQARQRRVEKVQRQNQLNDPNVNAIEILSGS